MQTVTASLKQPRRLPALTQHKTLRYFNFIALYIAQGIPEGMLFFGIPAWMAASGKTPGEIGSFVAVCGLPWSFKIIVAPMMDRFSYLPMGRRRPWVLFGQAGLILSFAAMAFVPDPLNNTALFMAAAFAISFFGAFQDVATDGMAIDIIPAEQQARANGFMWGSKIMGTSASLAIGSWLLYKYDFSTAILSLSVLVALIMLVPLFLKERPGEKLLPWTKGTASPEAKQQQVTSWKAIFTSLYKVFSLRNSLLFAMMVFVAAGAFNYIDTLLPIFTVQALGWSAETYSQYYATATLIGGIAGMLLGGILIDKFGKVGMLNIYCGLLIVIICALAFQKMYWPATSFIIAFMIAFQVLYVFTSIGMFAIGMQCCWKKISATQFTLYMTIANMGRVVGAKLIGPVKTGFSWEHTLLAFGGMIAIAWLIIQFIRINQHVKRVADFDSGTAMHKPLIKRLVVAN
ncbi:MAG: MFS transporter [Chitinophagaceae bacterium]